MQCFASLSHWDLPRSPKEVEHLRRWGVSGDIETKRKWKWEYGAKVCSVSLIWCERSGIYRQEQVCFPYQDAFWRLYILQGERKPATIILCYPKTLGVSEYEAGEVATRKLVERLESTRTENTRNSCFQRPVGMIGRPLRSNPSTTASTRYDVGAGKMGRSGGGSKAKV